MTHEQVEEILMDMEDRAPTHLNDVFAFADKIYDLAYQEVKRELGEE
jgi:hypothetical protein